MHFIIRWFKIAVAVKVCYVCIALPQYRCVALYGAEEEQLVRHIMTSPNVNFTEQDIII